MEEIFSMYRGCEAAEDLGVDARPVLHEGAVKRFRADAASGAALARQDGRQAQCNGLDGGQRHTVKGEQEDHEYHSETLQQLSAILLRSRRACDPPDQPDEALLQWSLCMIRSSLLRCRKRRAIEEEDFDLAQRVKAQEPAAAARLAAASSACGGPGRPEEAQRQLDRARACKRKAVEEEDYELASKLRRHELELEGRLSQRAAATSGRAAEAALRLVEFTEPAALLRACGAGEGDVAAGGGPELWQDLAADLQAMAAQPPAAS